MSDKQPMQADGNDGSAPDGVDQPNAGGGEGAGQSGGGAYPNPHTGHGTSESGFMGHGGQTDIGYHGTGQLGDEPVPGEKNDNSATREE